MVLILPTSLFLPYPWCSDIVACSTETVYRELSCLNLRFLASMGSVRSHLKSSCLFPLFAVWLDLRVKARNSSLVEEACKADLAGTELGQYRTLGFVESRV